MAPGLISKIASRYGAVIFFPTVAVTAIYADWSHTRKWKKSLKAKSQESLSN